MTSSWRILANLIAVTSVCCFLIGSTDGIWVNNDFAQIGAIENALDEENFFYPEDYIDG